LIVLSATIHGPVNGRLNSKANKKQWAKLQENLAAMSSNSQHVTAKGE